MIKWSVESRKLSELKAYEKNPRRITEKGLNDLIKSLELFGLAEPIVINRDDIIVGGHPERRFLEQVDEHHSGCDARSDALCNHPCHSGRLVIQREGQDIVRAALMDYWNCRCPLTGITEHALLRASYIVAWADCETDALRLNVHNGLLLSALWDAAFDAGLVSFSDAGEVLRLPGLSETAASALQLSPNLRLPSPTAAHRVNLQRHRTKYGY